MSYLRVEQIPKRRRRLYLRHCVNECGAACGNRVAGRKEATQILWVAGRAVYVCTACAKAMVAAYESATDEALAAEVEERELVVA